MSQQQATTPESDSEEMEEVKKMEKTGGGGGSRETAKEYLLFRGDAVFVTEMNVVCLIGPVTGEERITVTVKTNFRFPWDKDLHYSIGKSVKLGFLMKDYCDRSHIAKSNFQFTAQKTSKQIAENQNPEELGMRHGDVILLSYKPEVLQEFEDNEID
ncbi:hypothetical protein QN277_023295 [Acacia crassicarpa]|uniref:Uncharacterized protein n=1 Tax=Acacia crassicarpa TaxID=499986 RepID=A0AAE1MLU0_9FABA|nr:hypothetical protein QN277_023295 [Acacia crassicarpa]